MQALNSRKTISYNTSKQMKLSIINNFPKATSFMSHFAITKEDATDAHPMPYWWNKES